MTDLRRYMIIRIAHGLTVYVGLAQARSNDSLGLLHAQHIYIYEIYMYI